VNVFGSKKAYVVFAVCSWIVVAEVLFLAFEFTPWYPRSDVGLGAMMAFWLGVLLNEVSTPAALVIWIAMVVHCLARYRGSRSSKVLWSILCIPTACIGSTIYFFAVYSRQYREKRKLLVPGG